MGVESSFLLCVSRERERWMCRRGKGVVRQMEEEEGEG